VLRGDHRGLHEQAGRAARPPCRSAGATGVHDAAILPLLDLSDPLGKIRIFTHGWL